jgi:hypothetical protein
MEGEKDFDGLSGFTAEPDRFRESEDRSGGADRELTEAEDLWFVFTFFVGGWSRGVDSLR